MGHTSDCTTNFSWNVNQWENFQGKGWLNTQIVDSMISGRCSRIIAVINVLFSTSFPGYKKVVLKPETSRIQISFYGVRSLLRQRKIALVVPLIIFTTHGMG